LDIASVGVYLQQPLPGTNLEDFPVLNSTKSMQNITSSTVALHGPWEMRPKVTIGGQME
jgi:hypothetical protein